MIEYCLGFAFKPDDPRWVLLIRKNRPSWQAGLLNGVGGKLEELEDPQDAMIREFKEETGLDSDYGDWYELGILTGKGFRVYCYATKDVHWTLQDFAPAIWGPADPPEEEIVNGYFVPTLGINEPGVVSNLKWLIPMALNFFEDEKLLSVNATYFA